MKKKVVKKQNITNICFICGIANEAGLHTEFYELEDGTIAATAVAKDFHRSYPGRVHGGVSTALLDETIGRAIMITEPDTWGVTVEINTKYKKPVPYDVPLLITGRITKNSRLLFLGEGSIILPDGNVAVTASGKYMKMELSKIADFETSGEIWEPYLKDEDPEEFDIPD